MVSEDPVVDNPSLRTKLAKFLAGKAWPIPEPKEGFTTTAGVYSTEFQEWRDAFFVLETERLDIYEVLEEMEDTMEEVSAALDILADETVNPQGDAYEPFHIAYEVGYTPAPSIKSLIEQTIGDTKLQEKAFGILRDMLLHGDNFQQLVVDENYRVARLMHMPASSMWRNEDNVGLLKTGEEQGEWAFEQYEPRTSNFICGFYAWQVDHLRWNRRGSDPYGRGLFFAARSSYKKLRSMEEALVINWLTRAFARLLFMIDVTGKSPPEADQAIEKFRIRLQRQQASSDSLGKKMMTVPKDIYLGNAYHTLSGKVYEGLSDVKVLDTSNTGFWNLNPVEYYRDKVIVASRVPKAYLGHVADVRARATLAQLDRRFARVVRRCQQHMSFFVCTVVDLALLLKGFDPLTIPYRPVWPNPSKFDELDDSQALLNYARADTLFRRLQAMDGDYAARHHLEMTESERKAMMERLETQTKDQLEKLTTYGLVGDLLGAVAGKRPQGASSREDARQEETPDQPETPHVVGQAPGSRPNA